VPARYYEIRETELAVKFEGACMNRKGAGDHARLGGLVDDANVDPELGQPKRKDQTRGPGAGDQDVAGRHSIAT
jgi:hypothetical protein